MILSYQTLYSRISIFVLICGLVSSCSSTSPLISDEIHDFTTGDISGMIYNSKNRPCQGALITINNADEELSVQSDVDGRFILTGITPGTHRVTASKNGFETNTFTFDFSKRGQVIYIQLTGMETLLDMAEAALDALEWGKAKKALERSGAIDHTHSRFIALMGAYAYRTGDYPGAINLWLNLLKKGHQDPYIYLLLANTWEYGLKDFEEAAVWLKKYLTVRENHDVRERLKYINEEILIPSE